ncbi:transglycosylase SLT domain-containing protein [Streptomyces sp. SBT349]|uniref:transglycosylase SLT domain-containing protein n=1 Tax=Streptomyces sp. SBT349 TaxID=1580539 RepID=UPI0007C73675|nr:transglycosylase SLT domain-containing protein [Streptomyces sp. SBT349]
MSATTKTATNPAGPVHRGLAVAGLATASVAAVAAALIPHQAEAADHAGAPRPAGATASPTASPTAFTADAGVLGKAPGSPGEQSLAPANAPDVRPPAGPSTRAAAPQDDAESESAADAEAETDAETESVPEDGRGAEYTDDGRLVVIQPHEQPEPDPASDEDIDRWINEALDVMDEHGIPGSYEGIHRNLMRESSGDPAAINMWDSNAIKNIPSKGLLQVIDPTFEQYHVPGTSENPFDPVANIAAACNYAADRYGSMDNVDSAY